MVNEVIDLATRANPENRYASAVEMRDVLRKGLAGKLDGEPFANRLGRKVKATGKNVLKGLKYVGLGLTAPLWGPLALIGQGADNYGEEWKVAAGLAMGAVVYVGGSIGGCNVYENHREEQTRAAVVSYLENASRDLHLAFVNGNSLNVMPVQEILNEKPRVTEIPLAIPLGGSTQAGTNAIIGITSDDFYYFGTEKRQEDDKSEGKYPQVYVLNLHDGQVKPQIRYATEQERWTKGKVLQEAHLVTERVPYVVVNIDNAWYDISEGYLNRLNRVTLPFETPKTKLSGSDLEFNQGFSGGVQLNRSEDFWGDLELFSGTYPMVIEYSGQAETLNR